MDTKEQESEDIRLVQRAHTFPRRSQRSESRKQEQTQPDLNDMSLRERFQGQMLEDELLQYRTHIERLAIKVEEKDVEPEVPEPRWFNLNKFGIEPRRTRDEGKVVCECNE